MNNIPNDTLNDTIIYYLNYNTDNKIYGFLLNSSFPFQYNRSRILFGNIIPNDVNGDNMDIFIDVNTGKVYYRINDRWIYKSSILGAIINPILFGNNSPSRRSGELGQLYYNFVLNLAYIRLENRWMTINPPNNYRSIFAPPFLFGKNNPIDTYGQNNETYLNTLNATLFIKKNDRWIFRYNLITKESNEDVDDKPIDSGNIISVINFNSFGDLGNGISYLGNSGSVPFEVNTEVLITRPGKIKNLYIKLKKEPGIGKYRKFIVRLNGVDTVLRTMLFDDNTTGMNTTDELTVKLFDTITLKHETDIFPNASQGIMAIELVSS